MLVKTQEIIEYFTDYVQRKNVDDGIWYIGICQEAHDIVFEALKRSSQKWMYIEAGSYQIAKDVIDHFVCKGKAKRDTRAINSNETGSIVYVYRIKRAPATKKP